MKPHVSVLTVACVFAAAGPLHALRDDFDDDPALNSDWEVYQPLGDAGVKLEHQDSLLRAVFPAGTGIDCGPDREGFPADLGCASYTKC